MFTKKLVGSLIIIGALLTGVTYSTTSATARAGFVEKIFSKVYTGTVVDFRKNKLTIRVGRNQLVEIKINKKTEFSGQAEVGDQVIVSAQVKNDKIVALSVKVIPDKPRYGHDNDHGHGEHGDNDHRKHHDDGWNDGHDDGWNDGRNGGGNNRDNGDYRNRNGHNNDYNGGYDEGYERGYNEGRSGRR